MKFKTSLFLLLIVLIQYSCISRNEYDVSGIKLRINIPDSFTQKDSDAIDKFSEEGKELFKESGHSGFDNQKSIFFYEKGDFSLLKAKYYQLTPDQVENYKLHWDHMKGLLFDTLNKRVNEIEGAKIDSTSRIQKINGVKYYVFETNLHMLDLNNTNTRMKSLRYSTNIDTSDIVIDASYINQKDGLDIENSLRSLTISK